LTGWVVFYDEVKWAVFNFNAYKSPREDGIFVALLQEGLEAIIGPAMKIFRACIALRYVPLSWRVIRAVFIPELGHTSYV
jgi:hypothetical protein